MSENIYADIIGWLKKLKGWQTELAYRILDHNICQSDINDIIAMIKSQAAFVDKQFPMLETGLGDTNSSLRLLEISNIKNIEGLAPKKPLKFDEKYNLSVIYGVNGSGKSSYTKIIKQLSGKLHESKLKTNVFVNNSSEGECDVLYNLNGEYKQITWKISEQAIPDLSAINIFDLNVGHIYLNEANPCSYRPRIIDFFYKLAEYYGNIAQELQSQKCALVSKLPSIPPEYSITNIAKIYTSINKNSNEETLKTILEFLEDDSKQLKILQMRLSEPDPGKKAIEIRTYKKMVLQIANELDNALEKVNISARNKFYEIHESAVTKRQMAQDSASVLKAKSVLPAIGSPVWKKLWEAAKKYSEEEAYKEKTFPYIGEDSRCVLCHQKLDNSAKDRLQAFLEYVGGEIESEAVKAENSVADIIEAMPNIPSKEEIERNVFAAHLDTEWINTLDSCWNTISKLKKYFCMNEQKNGCSDEGGDKDDYEIKKLKSFITILMDKAQEYENHANIYDADAKNFDCNHVQAEVDELLAKKWCSEQKSAILGEIKRLQDISAYDEWISQCRTNAITAKAGNVADAVITTEYINRFNTELKKLNAGNLKVTISPINNKGQVKHSLKLVKTLSPVNPKNVFSEGECHIVSLAAFLADITANNNMNPIIFDDPVSSLDQEFEEKVIDRLVELSKTKQVIVFTHRLSVLGMLNEKAESCEIIGTRKETWGAGEIGNTPLFAKNTGKALNELKSHFLPKAKKAYQEGYDEYYPYAKQLCSDLRILVERSVEIDLLADVVQRYRRSVNTLGKIHNLEKITKEDCDLIDTFMTKYSCFEHSQSIETLVMLPAPDEIEKDINTLIDWQKDFTKRKEKN